MQVCLGGEVTSRSLSASAQRRVSVTGPRNGIGCLGCSDRI